MQTNRPVPTLSEVSPALRLMWDAIDNSARPEYLWRTWSVAAILERDGARTDACVRAIVDAAADPPAYMDRRDARRLRRVARLALRSAR